MCRIAAYMGPPCTLGDFVVRPEHGLSHQSWAAREMVSATVNADGWGAAWLDDEGRPCVYRQVLPIWADVNLESLARSLRSDLWLANVRSATAGLGTDYANTQPFAGDGLLFTHNGFIDRFAHTLRARMRAEVEPRIETTINGNTDSEYLFALIRQQRGDLVARVRTALSTVRGWLAATPDVRALLNVIVSDGQRLVAVRTACHGEAPSLYINHDWFGATAIASEPLDNHSAWEVVHSGEMIIAQPGENTGSRKTMTANAPTRLSQLRQASLSMLDGLSPAEQRAQSHPELSPMLWHVGHVFFVETYWLAERVFGDSRVTDEWRDLYFPEVCAKENRAQRLPGADAVRAWAVQVGQHNDAYWQRSLDSDHPLIERGYLAAFIRQHYAQHLETMRLARAQLMGAREAGAPATLLVACKPRAPEVEVPAGTVALGTAGIEAYDNEQPPCTTTVEAFAIGRRCVTNAEWLGFMNAGGYHTPDYWDDTGRAWQARTGTDHPQHWQPCADGGWHVTDDDPATPVDEQPVHGIGWFEACAFARYARARLPREVEWEAARRAGRLEDLHRVWEWCADAFHPYPGFRAFPYDGYSLPWFDGAHYVARGASRHSEPDIKRPGFRNFYPPTHRHVCAGLRLAR